MADELLVKSITNIYYDCLERIFDFLDLESLLMVAQTCKRLQIAAAAKFGDEFGKNTIRLYPFAPSGQKFFTNGHETKVNGLGHCLRFLRCFGAKLSDLRVNYGFEVQNSDNLNQYINQYGANTLTSIGFACKFLFSLQPFQKPFKNVGKVEISLCHFVNNEFANLVDFFPNLRDLEICDCSVHETASMSVHFPHLEHLTLDVYSFSRMLSMRLSYENAMNLLYANQHLKSLKINSDIELSMSTILQGISQNPIISKLVVMNEIHTKDVSLDELNRFVDQHPLMVDLILCGFRLKTVDAINFIRRMKSLKRIKFQVKNRSECNRLQKQLDKKWKCELSTNGDRFYIELNQ